MKLIFYNNDRWITKNQAIINISEMDDNHMQNCIRLLRNRIIGPWDSANEFMDHHPSASYYGNNNIKKHNARLLKKIKRFELELQYNQSLKGKIRQYLTQSPIFSLCTCKRCGHNITEKTKSAFKPDYCVWCATLEQMNNEQKKPNQKRLKESST